MKLVALALMLSVAAPLVGLSSTASLAQTPPAPAPGSPGTSPPMMQGMPPDMMQMMRMMQRMHSGAMSRMALMGGPAGMMPGATVSNIEGHIAFLKAEIKITEPQQKAWDEFADALRNNAKALAAAPNPVMSGMNLKLSARLEQEEKLLTLQVEALRRSRAAFEPLSAVLSDEQKKRLDELI